MAVVWGSIPNARHLFSCSCHDSCCWRRCLSSSSFATFNANNCRRSYLVIRGIGTKLRSSILLSFVLPCSVSGDSRPRLLSPRLSTSFRLYLSDLLCLKMSMIHKNILFIPTIYYGILSNEIEIHINTVYLIYLSYDVPLFSSSFSNSSLYPRSVKR